MCTSAVSRFGRSVSGPGQFRAQWCLEAVGDILYPPVKGLND